MIFFFIKLIIIYLTTLILHLYIHHTFVDLFKIVKYRTPISLYELFVPSPRNTNLLMCLPRINRDISKQNFVFSGSLIWNSVIGLLLNKCSPNEHGIMVQGSSECSDMSASISIIKKKLKGMLFETQKLETMGRANEWLPDNTFKPWSFYVSPFRASLTLFWGSFNELPSYNLYQL